MAATVSSPWTKSWALDSEQNEAELMAQPTKPDPPSSDFPSLAAAATTKPKKKSKPQTLSLAEFSTYSAPKPAPPQGNSSGLTQNELLMLPTGPRERTGEELDRNRLGGGFRNYGGGDRDRERSRVSDRREGNRERVDLGPSRADEVDDWSKSKKFSSFGPGPERRDKGGFFNSNRADEVDNWAANKSSSFGGGGGGDGVRRERRMGFDSYSNGSGSGSDNWLKKKQERGSGGGFSDGDSWGQKESNGPNERPKLNLQPRTLPVVRSESVTVEGKEGKVKGGGNPFGEARPREEVLKEKGKDWKEIDEKLEAVKLKEGSGGNGEKSEGFGGGRRRGFGSGFGDEKSVRTWRKPELNDVVVVAATPTGSSTDIAENNINTAESGDESAENAEKVPEEN